MCSRDEYTRFLIPVEFEGDKLRLRTFGEWLSPTDAQAQLFPEMLGAVHAGVRLLHDSLEGAWNGGFGSICGFYTDGWDATCDSTLRVIDPSVLDVLLREVHTSDADFIHDFNKVVTPVLEGRQVVVIAPEHDDLVDQLFEVATRTEGGVLRLDWDICAHYHGIKWQDGHHATHVIPWDLLIEEGLLR